MALLATPGRMVHFVMKDLSVRPLIVVHVFPNGADPTHPMVNGHLLLDGENDRKNNPLGGELDDAEQAPLTCWATSASRDDKKATGTWHWPERT